MRSLDIGASGMLAQQSNVEVIANNIANMQTTGFKRQRIEFQDLLYENDKKAGAQSSSTGTVVPTGIQYGMGTKVGAVFRNHSQGSLQQTGNPLDLAINGNGFFQIEMPSGEIAYSRAGTFQLNADGEVVTVDGYPVQPGLTVPVDALEIFVNKSGEIAVTLPAQPDPQIIGQIELANFVNPAGLQAIGDNLYLETEASGTAIAGNPNEDGFGGILQGTIEASNVNAVQEITNLIQAQRAYEMNSKVIETGDQMLSAMNNL